MRYQLLMLFLLPMLLYYNNGQPWSLARENSKLDRPQIVKINNPLHLKQLKCKKRHVFSPISLTGCIEKRHSSTHYPLQRHMPWLSRFCALSVKQHCVVWCILQLTAHHRKANVVGAEYNIISFSYTIHIWRMIDQWVSHLQYSIHMLRQEHTQHNMCT